MYVIHPLFLHYQAGFWACSLELVWSVFLSCHFGLGKYFCLFVVRIKRKSNKENRISLFSSETFTLFHVKYSTMIIDGVIYFFILSLKWSILNKKIVLFTKCIKIEEFLKSNKNGCSLIFINYFYFKTWISFIIYRLKRWSLDGRNLGFLGLKPVHPI